MKYPIATIVSYNPDKAAICHGIAALSHQILEFFLDMSTRANVEVTQILEAGTMPGYDRLRSSGIFISEALIANGVEILADATLNAATGQLTLVINSTDVELRNRLEDWITQGWLESDTRRAATQLILVIPVLRGDLASRLKELYHEHRNAVA